MNLVIHPIALDLLATFLSRRLLAPSDIPVEAATRTGAALARATVGWREGHRRTENSLHSQLLDIRHFSQRAAAEDLRLARALGGS
ncbi:hypothetical protein CATRI_12075 [Corynebacterium atrinae]|uniref:hypothetical protein n=1 Tax=Corynebacterium atrinae TaxID=1336740 RepID=UPI0025B3E8E9|nr:hypothetical protein [Corynebacterium atrinae]WJY64464.1 hypothetical protein CATRI_12075 [Corynebacterium atrinae]